MEGKEHYEDDDDKRKSDSSDNSDYFEDSDSDEFGLPEMEDADHSYKKDSDDTFTSDYSSDSDYTTSSEKEIDESEYTYNEEEEYDTPTEVKNYNVHGLDDDERSGPGAGLIIFLIIILIGAIGFGVWYFMFRAPEPPPPPPITQPVDVAPDTLYDEPEPEPIIKDETSSVAGTVIQLNSPTGRYYVVIASFVDDDLAMDYGNKLAKQGTGTILLSPKADKGFYRLAIADFQSLKDAALSAEEAKSTYGNDVWVIRY